MSSRKQVPKPLMHPAAETNEMALSEVAMHIQRHAFAVQLGGAYYFAIPAVSSLFS